MIKVKKARGAYLYTVSHGKMLDTSMGSGSQILGHGNAIANKISKQIKNGTIYSCPNQYTDRVNSYLKNHITPTFDEEYIFCSTGTEANMRALRLARAYTGKEKIARFHGGWHGGLCEFLTDHPSACGVSSCAHNSIKILPYNDDKCFDMITSDLAAVIIEPVQGSNPRCDIKPFLQKLREKCNSLGIVLIFDEVMTGFRLGKKGGAGLFNIQPDIVTYGKVLGGGFPIGALGAKKDILKTKNVFYGGTFSGNPLSMHAAELILKNVVNEKDINYQTLHDTGALFRNELNKVFIEKGIERRAMGCGSMNRIIFTDIFIKNRKDRDLLESFDHQKFHHDLAKKQVFLNPNGIFHFSMCHTPSVINNLIDKIIN
tara:strand:- start:60504 stop:61619 length:1116 start_codon:yes stop_codon:yes gene_type:complete